MNVREVVYVGYSQGDLYKSPEKGNKSKRINDEERRRQCRVHQVLVRRRVQKS